MKRKIRSPRAKTKLIQSGIYAKMGKLFEKQTLCPLFI